MELSRMVFYLIRRRYFNIAWWSDSAFGQVQTVLSKQGAEQIIVHDVFANNMELVLETVRNIARSKLLLSDLLHW